MAQVIAFPPPNLQMSGTNDIAVFDLTITESYIIGGQDPTFLVVTFYVSQADADNALNAIAFPESYINTINPQVIFARIEDSSNGNFDTNFFEIFVIPAPTIFQPSPLKYCDPDNDGFGEFTLTDADLEVTGGIPQGNLVVTHHYLEADAVNGVLPLPITYLNDQPFQQTVFVRLFDQSTGCFSTTTLELIVQPTPEINTVDDIILIDEDGNGIEIFDLTVRESQILNGQAATITYHETEADAETNINAIVNPTSYVNISNPQTIYYRLENVDFCYSVGNFTLILVDALIEEEPDGIFIDEGDNDGSAIFDLTVNEAQMLGDQNPAIALFTYHTSFEDSENGINSIATPTAYLNNTNPQTIYVRLTNNNTGFYVLTSFVIETDGVLGIEENILSNLKLYSNPISGIITLQSSNLIESTDLTIYNIQGQIIIAENKIPSNEIIQVDISNLTTGIYFIKIVSGENSVIKRVIKK
ncbi:MAG: T9SS type A sorting domain-containing protein [Flavobacteriaceae bacterium]